MNPAPLPDICKDPAALKERVLEIIRAESRLDPRNPYLDEGVLRRTIFPAPDWPAGAVCGSPEARAWQAAERAWSARMHAGSFYDLEGEKQPGIPYGESVTSLVSAATIALAAEGRIHTVNNGCNCYAYRFLK